MGKLYLEPVYKRKRTQTSILYIDIAERVLWYILLYKTPACLIALHQPTQNNQKIIDTVNFEGIFITDYS